jgi:hypothetical protein
MTDRIHAPNRKLHVLLAVAVLVLLGTSLGFRLAANPGRGAGDGLATPDATRDHATVPEPKPFRMADLEIPHWSHQNAREWPVEFKTDLDMLAPLGNGTRNAGAWYVEFRKPDGPRYEEARAMMERREEREGSFANVLPPNDPLLLEAEPWCDQATMSFYPELIKPNGWYTQIPNLLVPLTFARSWVARGVESKAPETGLDDCRRAIRLGRLLRQEDTVVISDLVGLACIRMGAQGIYDIAVREGDAELALLASIVIGEVAPQRLLTSERITRSEVSSFLRNNEFGETVLELPDARLETTMDMARNQPGRRFRAEAILQLNVVRWLGTEAQQQRAIELLTELRDLDDPVLSETARWSLETKPTPEQLEDIK